MKRVVVLFSVILSIAFSLTTCTTKKNEKVEAEKVILTSSKITLREGETAQNKFKVIPEEASYGRVVWTSTNAQVAVVSPKGVITAKSVGEATIKAILENSVSQLSGDCLITVLPKREREPNISLNTTVVSLVTGSKYSLEVILAKNIEERTVVWASSDDKLATVDVKGEITAILKGKVIITATLKDVPDSSATCEVNISKRIPDVKEISISPRTLSLEKGEISTPFIVKITPADANQEYTLSLSEGADQFVTLDVDAKTVTAKASGQTINVIATSVQDSKKTALSEVQLIIKTIPITSLTVDSRDKIIHINQGETNNLEIRINVTPSDASDKSYSFSIIEGEDKISLINNNKNFRGDHPGTAKIKVTSNSTPAMFDTFAVIVEPVKTPVKSIVFQGNITGLNVTVGERKSLTVIVQPANASDTSLNWTIAPESLNSSSITIAPNGNTCSITGVSLGGAIVKVSSVSTPSISARITVRVK